MKVILLTISLLTSVSLYAQEKSRTILSLDFGLSASKDISFDDYYNDERRMYAPSFGLNVYSQIKGIHWITTGLNYYQIGDVYDYYTGRNYETTDVRIYVNTIKIPALYSMFFDKGKRVNFLIKAGPSADLIFGESIIKPKATLNNLDGFRNNVSQGKVGNRLFVPLNIAAGLSFKNKEGVTKGYLEVLWYGRAMNIYDDFSGSTSSYNNFSIRYGVFVTK